jgi:hypothetical protein
MMKSWKPNLYTIQFRSHACVFCIFNDFMFVQIFLIVIVFFFYTTYEPFFLIINSVFFLSLVVIYSWLSDLDILINFLVIIDLGVFFLFFAFLINLLQMFSVNFIYNWGAFRWFIYLFIGSLTLVFEYSLSFNTLIWEYSTCLNFWQFLVSYYNWFFIQNWGYFTDLQLLSDIYFKFNFFEFFIMNFIIYLTIVLIFFVLNINQTIFSQTYLTLNLYFVKYLKFNFYYYAKSQNFVKQLFYKTNVRVWDTKVSNKFDFKTNVGNFGW